MIIFQWGYKSARDDIIKWSLKWDLNIHEILDFIIFFLCIFVELSFGEIID